MKLVARIISSVAAASSLVFVVMAGSRAPAVLLVAFILWNFVPFAALAAISFRSTPTTSATTSYLTTTIVGGLAILAYAYFWVHPRDHQPASPYLVIPGIGWIVVAAFLTLYWKRKAKDQTLT